MGKVQRLKPQQTQTPTEVRRAQPPAMRLKRRAAR